MSAPKHDWPFAAPSEEDEKDPKRFYGVTTGIVIDPLGACRCNCRSSIFWT